MLEADDIARIIGAGAVTVGDDVALLSDRWDRPSPCKAKAIASPKETDEISRLLRACHAACQPVTVLGGGTGLVGGTVSSSDEIVLSLRHMDKIERIDPINRTALVGAGVTIQALQQAAQEADLSFGVDFGSRGSATIGGAIATNDQGQRRIRSEAGLDPKARWALSRVPSYGCGPQRPAATRPCCASARSSKCCSC